MKTSVPPITKTAPSLLEPRWLGLIFILITGVLVLIWSEIRLFPPCIFRSFTGLPCSFCGGTRALRALMGLNLGTAFSFNPLVTCLCFLGVFMFVSECFRCCFWRRAIHQLPTSFKNFLLLAVFLINWVYVIKHLN